MWYLVWMIVWDVIHIDSRLRNMKILRWWSDLYVKYVKMWRNDLYAGYAHTNISYAYVNDIFSKLAYAWFSNKMFVLSNVLHGYPS